MPPRNDQNKIADILQYRKGYIHFCHRFPVKYLWNTFTGGYSSLTPGYYLYPVPGH